MRSLRRNLPLLLVALLLLASVLPAQDIGYHSAQDAEQKKTLLLRDFKPQSMLHVPQHTRPERHRIERHAVTPQRRLGLDAADDVVPGVLVEILPRFGDDFVQVEEFVALGSDLQAGSFVEFIGGHEGYALLVAGTGGGTLARGSWAMKAHPALAARHIKGPKERGPGR